MAIGRPNPSAKFRHAGGAKVRSVACSHCKNRYLDYVARLVRARRHYCSAACQRIDRRGKKNPHWRGGPSRFRCKQCRKKGRRYITPRAGRRDLVFCSIPCKAKWQRGRSRP